MDPSVPVRAPQPASGSDAAPAVAPISFGFKRPEGYTGSAMALSTPWVSSWWKPVALKKQDDPMAMDDADLNDGFGL